LPSRASSFKTRELTEKTWRDFERLFRKPGEWGACWCVYYQRPGPLPKAEMGGSTPEQRATRNRRDKKELVEKGCAHGVLVYSRKELVGWCQYGASEERGQAVEDNLFLRGQEVPQQERGKCRVVRCIELDTEEGRGDGRSVSRHPKRCPCSLVRNSIYVQKAGIQSDRSLRQKQCPDAAETLSPCGTYDAATSSGLNLSTVSASSFPRRFCHSVNPFGDSG